MPEVYCKRWSMRVGMKGRDEVVDVAGEVVRGPMAEGELPGVFVRRATG